MIDTHAHLDACADPPDELVRRALREPNGAEHTRAALVEMGLLPSRG